MQRKSPKAINFGAFDWSRCFVKPYFGGKEPPEQFFKMHTNKEFLIIEYIKYQQ